MSGFWAGRNVLITGHTGFKGAWLAFWLAELGARVSGLALKPATMPNLHDILDVPERGNFVQADITDTVALEALMMAAQPEIVFHLAAQALVRPSYQSPVATFSTNVVGTVAVLDAVRRCPRTRAVIVVTSDKAYENREWPWGYRETDALGGHDPYSASKGCTELAATSMRRSFFGPGGHAAQIATVRAGNVIGGGDWSADRLVPDIVKGCLGEDRLVRLRNPQAMRPWQHVLEPLAAYLLLAERLAVSAAGQPASPLPAAWNIGPDSSQNRRVIEVAEALVSAFGRGRITAAEEPGAPHEAHTLTLDCAQARHLLGWQPRLNFAQTVAMTAEWYAAWARGADLVAMTRRQLEVFEGLSGERSSKKDALL